jgi:hypothetical protein
VEDMAKTDHIQSSTKTYIHQQPNIKNFVTTFRELTLASCSPKDYLLAKKSFGDSVA